jgi:hypothetical protein
MSQKDRKDKIRGKRGRFTMKRTGMLGQGRMERKIQRILK